MFKLTFSLLFAAAFLPIQKLPLHNVNTDGLKSRQNTFTSRFIKSHAHRKWESVLFKRPFSTNCDLPYDWPHQCHHPTAAMNCESVKCSKVKPIVIAEGMLGSSTNWSSLAVARIIHRRTLRTGEWCIYMCSVEGGGDVISYYWRLQIGRCKPA